MTYSPPGTIKQELEGWLDEDLIVYILRRKRHDNLSYREIADDLSESGYKITGVMVANWVSYAKKTGAI